ncbi:unnamed protein product [Prorocentrum cordatum]|uniref:Uncharacterized protein n=1 Tax=Prorocentrum cordatum TaxID=2364126 RepID=A0ABN9RBH6_9DINO|nr:unnamed protein product [Polarella glacialis]
MTRPTCRAIVSSRQAMEFSPFWSAGGPTGNLATEAAASCPLVLVSSFPLDGSSMAEFSARQFGGRRTDIARRRCACCFVSAASICCSSCSSLWDGRRAANAVSGGLLWIVPHPSLSCFSSL